MPFPVLRELPLPTDAPPTLVVVVDTEEEFDWSAPFDAAATSTLNIVEQPRAQAVFDRWGIAPTYVVDYPVATSKTASALLADIARDGRCEIGTHLHPWVNPPLPGAASLRESFAGNLPEPLERAKIKALTTAIADAFGRRPVVYKAGRYGVGPRTASILAELGYRYDVSVVAHADFTREHGPDFSRLPGRPFLAGPKLAELPLSVEFVGFLARHGRVLHRLAASPLGRRLHLPGIAARTGLVERLRLSPEGHSLDEMVRMTRAGLTRGQRYFMLTYHSSSLLPGATSYVRTKADRDAFLAKLDGYLRFFLAELRGRTETVTSLGRKLLTAAGVSEFDEITAGSAPAQ